MSSGVFLNAYFLHLTNTVMKSEEKKTHVPDTPDTKTYIHKD